MPWEVLRIVAWRPESGSAAIAVPVKIDVATTASIVAIVSLLRFLITA